MELRGSDDLLPDRAFVVAVETDCTPATLERINSWALAGRRPWMLVGAWNRRLLVGPIFVPGETACYECYRKRLASHRAHLEAYQALEACRLTHSPAVPREPVLPALCDIAAAHAALELFHFATRLSPARTVGRVLVYDPVESETTVESILRIPWCPLCASIAPQAHSGETELPRSPAEK
jgi:ribosomal protein S12 methylthiotransferase accessory factor